MITRILRSSIVIKWRQTSPYSIGFKVQACCTRFSEAYSSGQIIDIPFHQVGFKDGKAFKNCPYCGAPVVEEKVDSVNQE